MVERKYKKNISVYLHLDTIEVIDKLIDYSIFPSRSAIINNCIEVALPLLIEQSLKLKKAIKLNDLPDVLGFLKKHGFLIINKNKAKVKVPLGNIYFNSNNKKVKNTENY